MLTIRALQVDMTAPMSDNSEGDFTDFHFCLMTYGKCVYWVNDNRIVLNKGDILLIPNGIKYRWKQIPTVFHTKYVVHFEPISKYPLLPILASKVYLHRQVGCFSVIYEKMKIIGKQWTEKTPYFELYTSSMLIEILIHINRELDRADITPMKHRYVESMKRYIQEHYREKITKEELAEVIQKSPNHTATLFSSITGQTISNYVHSIRMRTAVYMLEESQLTITELSEFLGYNDVSYFSRIFKQIIGVSPSDYLLNKSIHL
ncbi:helix-turn-helix transcriptional regulator [Paenibacillus sp. HW567]|uniref:helix-turn-helix transcriptional regulator n=1 Tax=Paenibacillus sp. HW567 TaxID=1034769 RepID=UPI0003746317|nr:AraC family transcriptional regulator [Paenibacillus sp. HW567]